MKCTTKFQLELALREYKKTYLNAMMLVDTYMEGSPTVGVKKDLKKALDILKYWEKHHDIMEYNHFINFNICKIYKLLGKEKLADEYNLKYYENQVKKKKNYIEIRCLIEAQFKQCYNADKQKVTDKKMFEKLLTNVDLFFENASDASLFTYGKNIASSLIHYYRNVANKLYMVHILSRYYENSYSNRKESMELISKFSNTDFKNYFALLDKPSFDKYKNFGNALKLYYKYNFEDCDDNVKYEYGKALCLVNNYPIIAPNLGEKIIKELYDKGHKKAFDVLINYYTNNKLFNTLYDFLVNHLKKHKKDGKAQVMLAEFYFKDSYKDNKVCNKNKFIAALKYYENNYELLNEEQSTLLSQIYAQGIGVEVDLEKAQLYSKTYEANKIIEQEEIKQFNRIKVKNKKLQPLIDDLKTALTTLDEDKLIKLFTILRGNLQVYEDDDLLFKLAIFMEKHKMDFAYYALLFCYVSGRGVEKNIDKYAEYRDILMNMENKYSYFVKYLYHNSKKEYDLAIECLKKSCEEGFVEAKYNLARDYCNEKLGLNNFELGYKLFKELYEEKHYEFANKYAILYEEGKYEEYNVDKHYEILHNLAHNACNPYVCEMFYEFNKKNNKGSEKENIEILKIAAENGSNFAIKELIYIYKNTDLKEYLKYAKKGHENGLSYATIELANLYFYGNDELKIKVDNDKSYEMFNSLEAKTGYVYFMLGKCHYYGYGTKVNYDKAFEYLNIAYEKDVQYAPTHLANCYKKGYGTEVNYEKALELYKEGSKLGGYYLYCYANLYLYGLGDLIQIDYEKAIELYKECIKEYKAEDIYLKMGYCYEKLLNFKEAEKCYNEALKINKDYDLAYNNLGSIYSNSLNLDRDYNKALEYYKKAASLGFKASNLYIAEIYIYQNYGFSNHKLAEPYLLKAYDDKVEGAATLLAYSYFHAKNDEKKSYEIIKEVKEESALKFVTLGNLYYSGKFLNKDYNEAFKYYQKAYDLSKEDPYVYFRLGKCYYFGHGVERDLNRAYDLISLAKNEGFKEAESFIEEYFTKR